MRNETLKMLIYYLVAKLGSNLSRTKIVKLLFFIDYIAKNGKQMGIGKTISGTEYYYYTHGPFSQEIIDSINEMNGKEIIEQDIGSPDEFKSHYVYSLGRNPRININFTPEQQKIIDFVIKEYGSLNLNRILQVAYSVPEMKDAQILDVILK